jgi:nitrogen fixation NifU-like protein
MENPDGYAFLRGVCGDGMEIFLKFNNDRVKDASFRTDGCGSSTVCGSFAAEMAIGKNPDELLEVTPEAIIQRLGGIPKEDEHCASLASETLQEALNNYMMKQVHANDRELPEK